MQFLEDLMLHGPGVQSVLHTADSTVYQMICSGGSGVMTSFPVFDGIELIYNDFHAGSCVSGKCSANDIMEINHCRKGRFECDFSDGSCVYLEEDDLAVNMLNNQTQNPCFPLEVYSGVSVLIDLRRAEQSLSGVLSDISIDLQALRGKLCPGNRCFVMRASDSIRHIFSELYTVPDQVKFGYFKIKVLELLLFLSVLEPSDGMEQHRYFQKNQVERVKQMRDSMVQNIESHFTLAELSARFDLPITAMKLCFKGIYGISIYAYMRDYRMRRAAVLLCESKASVSEIAGQLGYANASKFSSAFKQVMGLPPLEYRKRNCPNGAGAHGAE